MELQLVMKSLARSVQLAVLLFVIFCVIVTSATDNSTAAHTNSTSASGNDSTIVPVSASLAPISATLPPTMAPKDDGKSGASRLAGAFLTAAFAATLAKLLN
jgi:hypothetical protein